MLVRRTGILLALVAVLGLSACDSVKRTISGAKRAPDEFAVYKRPPLSLPPDYGLRPPEPGRERVVEDTPRDQARSVLLRREVKAENLGNATPGVVALLDKTGANTANPDIRKVVDEETLALSEEDKRLIDKLIFWKDEKEFQGTVVDAAKEQRRLLETQALGKPINEGKTPEIVRKDKGGIFNW